MGSKKYPDENTYDSFVSSHGGSCNAMTEGEYTIYQFVMTSQEKEFNEALDIFAQCFISPLLSVSCSDREINAIENEFQLAKTSDSSRIQQLYCSNCDNNNNNHNNNKKHFLKKFSWGNLYSLKIVPEQNKINLNELLHQFYGKWYTPNRMKLVVYSPMSLVDIKKSVEIAFDMWLHDNTVTNSSSPDMSSTGSVGSVDTGSSNHKKQKVSVPSINTENYFPSLIDLMKNSVDSNVDSFILSSFPYMIPQLLPAVPMQGDSPLLLTRIIPIKDSHKLNLKFQMPPILKLYDYKPESYYSHLLGHEGIGSLLSALKRFELASGLCAGVCSDNVTNNSLYSVFEINVTLTTNGVANWIYVIVIIYEYLNVLKEKGPQQWVFDELQQLAQIEYGNLLFIIYYLNIIKYCCV